MFVVRFLGSMMLACVVVIVMLVAGLKLFGVFERTDSDKPLNYVELLSTSDRMDLAEVLGEDPASRRPRLPELADIPPFELPERRISGFVQLEVQVDEGGEVTDATVIGATPRGYYEEQAREIVLRRRYPPDLADGQPVPSVHSEIIKFNVPAREAGTPD